MATSNFLPIADHDLPLYISGVAPITLRNNAENCVIQTDNNSVTVNLPALSGELNGVVISFLVSGSGTIAVTAAGGDTIQGAGSYTLNTLNGTFASFLANHTTRTWYVISGSTVTAQNLGTTGAPVNVSGSAPPVAGQALIANDATHATWQYNYEIATTGAPVSTAAAAPPAAAGQGLFATSVTTAAWQYTPSLGTTGAPVVVNTAAPPSAAGQVLTSTSATAADWQYPGYLATTGSPVNVLSAAPPTAGQALVATDATHATWQTPAAASLGYGHFYGLAPGDYAATIAINAPFPFPNNAVTAGGIVRNGVSTTDFILPVAGDYRVSFETSVTEPGQVTAWVDPNTGTFARVPYTCVGRATGTNQIIMETIIHTTANNSKLQIRNDASAAALTVTLIAGGTNATATTLTIVRLA
jgi:hypothetical protein